MTVRPPLCEHSSATIRVEAYRAVCGTCGSFWDLDSLNAPVAYDASYPEARGHYDSRVGALKVRTLKRWLQQTRLDLTGKVVCEVGFGGGACLPLLAERAGHVIGLEANASAIERVRASGVRAELASVIPLPALAATIDVWLFQDVFEHIPDPSEFVDWMCRHSATDAEILIVLPRGDSLSRRLLGRFWIHKLPDHEFHWSRAGLIEFFARRGFVPRTEFFPVKYVSPRMVAAHARHKLGATRRAASGHTSSNGGFALPFNFGEFGAVFRRR